MENGAGFNSLGSIRPEYPTVGGSPDQGKEAFCEHLGVVGSSHDCTLIEDAILGLGTAPLGYNKPDSMVRGKRTAIALIVDLSGKSPMVQELRGFGGQIVEAESKVARHMSAELSGPAFDIEPKGAQRKLITAVTPTRWTWTVVPIEHGEDKLLQLDLFAHIEVDGDVSPAVRVRTYQDRIYVNVTTWDLVKDFVRDVNPVYSFAAALAVAGGGLYAWFRRRKSQHFRFRRKAK